MLLQYKYMFLTKPSNIDSSLLETAKQSQNSARRMFDTNNVSARSYMSYQAFLPAVYLQNYSNAIKVKLHKHNHGNICSLNRQENKSIQAGTGNH